MESLKMIRLFFTLCIFRRCEGGGCSFKPDSYLFRKEFERNNPAITWTFKIKGEPKVVANKVGWPTYKWMPDGRISTVKNKKTGQWMIFYPNHESYRTVGPSPLPDKSITLNPRRKVIGGKINANVFNNGGMWLMAVYPTDNRGSMVGFVHAEDRFYNGGFPNSNKIYAYKSVALACSRDYGSTWQVEDRLVSRGEKPKYPGWSGTGDQDVVWDWINKRWYMATYMSAAVSYDKSGKGGSWKKWDGKEFSRTGFKDDMEKLRDTKGYLLPSGANPAIHWNTYLQLWVMVYHGWDGRIYITSSRDLPHFDPPRVLLDKEGFSSKNWYPTLISRITGDRRIGRQMFLYYRYFPTGPGNGKSQFRMVKVRFFR